MGIEVGITVGEREVGPLVGTYVGIEVGIANEMVVGGREAVP